MMDKPDSVAQEICAPRQAFAHLAGANERDPLPRGEATYAELRIDLRGDPHDLGLMGSPTIPGFL